MKPALTPEEWAKPLRIERNAVTFFWHVPGHELLIEEPGVIDSSGVRGADLHALAALCLHGQPFGFTREDVKDLRELATATQDDWESEFYPPWLRDLADRIEALLPPETP